MEGVAAAYYLIHSMAGSDDFHERDLIAARNFGEAAKNAGVSQIIYLGGLGDPAADLSEHLASRQATGKALAEAGVPVTEFRAAIIVGAGSIAFEMIRYLTERIPVMICPKWVFTRVQPIAIDDVLDYLTKTLERPESLGQVIEIGGVGCLHLWGYDEGLCGCSWVEAFFDLCPGALAAAVFVLGALDDAGPRIDHASPG